MRRLRRFDYHEPASVGEAVTLLASQGGAARVLAGGTDLLVDMKGGGLRPSAVVNLKRIPGLDGIERVAGGTRIGALTKVSAVECSAQVRERLPALAGAAGVLATPSVRGLATVGGNIARASPASDLAPALIVYGAVATVEGPQGVRREPVEGLFTGPGATTLAAHDLITAVFVPDPAPRTGAVHLKIGTRGGGTDIAVAGVCAGVTLDADRRIAAARIVLASVAPTPMRASEAERFLVGAEASDEALGAAAQAAAGECRPVGDVRAGASHRRALVRVLARRALGAAVAAARDTEGA